MNLNSILIGSEDPQRLTAYYTRLFGEPGWAGGDFRGWRVGSGCVTVGTQDRVHRPNPQPDKDPGGWIATFADPDDNYFQLASPFPG